MELKFARHTSRILDMLPHWFRMRKQSDGSIGARFLNIAGLELDDAIATVDYAYKQCYINTADITQPDFCYKAIIPMPLRAADIQTVFAASTGLKRANTLKEFFGIDVIGIKDAQLYLQEQYFLDEERNIIYVRQKFGVDATHDNGKIRIVFNSGELELGLSPHHVWNYLDELGALMSCPRIPEEPNVEYKERIKDVFWHKAGASGLRLINGIGRELATRKTVEWDVRKDLELVDPMIVLNSITLDLEPLDLSKIWITAQDTVLIKADPGHAGMHKVSYVHGVNAYELWNKEADVDFLNELFTVEGKPTDYMLQLAERTNAKAPMFWNDFRWDEHYWNPNDPGTSGTGYIPNLYDGSISGFKSYKGRSR